MILTALIYLLIFSLGINLGIWVCIFTRLLKKTDISEPATQQSVSVIICSRNAAWQLQNNLSSFQDQEYQNKEILVIDDDSSDHTTEILTSFKAKYAQLRFYTIHKTKEGKKEALAYGISKADNKWIALSDADCQPVTSRWLKSMMAQINPPIKIVLGYSPFFKHRGWLNKLIRFECCMNAIQYLSAAKTGFPYMGTGRNLVYEKSLFETTAIRMDFPAGDDDLLIHTKSNKENTTINLDPESFVYSNAPTSYRDYFVQKWRHYSTSLYYKPQIQIYLLSYFISLLIFTISCFYLLFTWAYWIAIATFVIKLMICWPLFYKFSKRLREKDLAWFFPLLEIAYLIHLILQAPFLFIKKKSW